MLGKATLYQNVLRRKIKDPPRDVPGVLMDEQQIEVLASSGQCCFTKQFLTKRALRHEIEDLLRDVLGVPTDGPQIAILASSSQ